MVRRLVRRVFQRVFGSNLFRDAVRSAVLSEEFRSQMKSALTDIIATSEFRKSLAPHYFGLAFEPDVNGMDPAGAVSRVDRGVQLLLLQQHRDRLARGETVPFAEAGFRAFSPNDEDGLLLYLFAILGTPTRRCIELGAGAGFDGYTTNLLVNHGFHGLLLERDPALVAKAQLFYETRPDTCLAPPQIAEGALHSGNVEAAVRSRGFSGDIDVLAIQLDGLDYWVWQALTCVNPRIVLVPYHPGFGPNEAKTVPDSAEFAYDPARPAYAGASLLALQKLGERKGYRLVGFNRPQSFAFFVRHDLAERELPAVSVASGLSLDRHRVMRESLQALLLKWDWVTL